MKRIIVKAIVVYLFCAYIAVPIYATETAVGTPKGLFQVNESGAAVYSLILDMPKGIGGMQPSVGVTYNSQGGNGIAGWGCNITGISAITLAPKDIYHDGVPKGITSSEGSAFYLDGKRLLLKSGSSGTVGATYSLESDPFAEITALYFNLYSGFYFQVKTSDGMTYEYGSRSDAQMTFYSGGTFKTYTWYLRKVVDARGNYIEYEYTYDGYYVYPNRINYGCNENGTNLNERISFDYESRTDIQPFYLGSTSCAMEKRLKYITTSESNNIYRKYEFEYDTTSDNFSRLTSITEKNGSGEELRPITLNWNFLPGIEQTVGSVPETGNVMDYFVQNIYSKNYYSCDMNNDGISDIIQVSDVRETNNDLRTHVNLYCSNLQSDGSVTFTNSSSCQLLPNVEMLGVVNRTNMISQPDLDGDGYNDLLFTFVSNPDGYKTLSYQYVLHPGAQQNIYSSNTSYYYPLYLHSDNPICVAGDMSNNGKTDVFCLDAEPFVGKYWSYFMYFNGSRLMPSGSQLSLPSKPKGVFVGDYNSDGLQDVIVFCESGYKIFWNDGRYPEINPFSDDNALTGTNISYADRIRMGDFNGDGVIDFLLNHSTDSEYYFALGRNDGTFSKTIACNIDLHNQYTSADDNRFTILITDFNNDGKSDVILGKAFYLSTFFTRFAHTQFRWMQSDGTTLTEVRRTQTNGEDDASIFNTFLGDFTGTGKVGIMNYGNDIYTPVVTMNNVNSLNTVEDNLSVEWFIDETVAESELSDSILAVETDSLANRKAVTEMQASMAQTKSSDQLGVFHYYTNTGYTASSGKVSNITDGFGNVTTIGYASLANGNVYQKGTGSAYPMVDITLPLHVVSSSTEPVNGVANISKTYQYGGLKAHLQGKGLLGFSSMTVNNITSGQTTITEVGNWDTYFFVPLQKTETITQGGYTATIENQSALIGYLYGNNSYWVHPESKTETDIYGNVTTTTYSFDTYKGYLVSENTQYGSSSMYRETTYSGYQQKGGTWLPTTVTIRQKHEDCSDLYSASTKIAYTDNGLKASQTDFYGTNQALLRQYTYDACGNVLSESISGNGVPQLTTHYTYTSARFPSRIYTSPSSTDIRYTYDRWGNPLTEADYTSGTVLTTTYEYDTWGNRTRITTPTGNVTDITIGWDSGSNSLHYVQESAEGSPTKTTYYDRLGRASMSVWPGAGGTTERKIYNYGNCGQLSSEVFVTGRLSYYHPYTYDELGRKVSEMLPSSQYIYYSYGNRSMTTTTNNHSYTKTFDAWGNVKTSSDPFSSVAYTYHSNGKPATATTDSATVSMDYDAVGNQILLSDPDAGSTEYEYDALGRITLQTDARGVETQNVYDNIGRIASTTIDGVTTTYTYGVSGNQKMRLIREETDEASIVYGYDQYGRITSETRTLTGESPLAFAYTYNSLNQMASITYPGSLTVSYQYDSNGYRNKVMAGGNTLWQLSSYNGTSTVSLLGGSLTSTVTRNNTGIAGISMKKGSTALSNLTFVNNGATGNLTSRSGMLSSTETFTYDALDRLTGVTVAGTTAMSINYADNGNISSKTGLGAYTYANSHPHAVAQVVNTSGLVPTATQTILYNGFGKIESISDNSYGMEFTYGPDQQRWKTILSSNGSTTRTTLYANDYERVTEGGVTRQFYFLEGGAVYVKQSGQADKVYYICADNLGSILKLVDANGASVFEATYDAWGKQSVTKNTIGFHRGYTGHEMMPKFGLVNMNGRLYDPVLARFLSPDNYVQLPDFSQNFNRYSYCLNNPLRYTDLSGEWLGWDDLIVSAFTFVVGYVSNSISTGNWGWSSVQSGLCSALSSWIGYNTIGGASMWSYIAQSSINTTINTFVPTVNIPIGNHFALSVSPAIGIGAGGLSAGLNIGGIYQNGDFSIGTNIGFSSNYWGWYGEIGINDFHAGYGRTQYGSTSAYGETIGYQTIGTVKLGYGDVSFALSNDLFGEKHQDRWRTSAAELSIGNFSIGTYVVTNDGKKESNYMTNSEPSLLLGLNKRFGAHTKGEVYSAPLWIGYRYKNQITRLGYSHPFVQDLTQNAVHHYFKPGAAPDFVHYNNFNYGFFSYVGYYNPLSLWNY